MAIRPKNDTDIEVDNIAEKTSGQGVAVRTAKQLSSNGQDLLVGTESAHDVAIMTNSIARYAFDDDGNIVQRAAGGSALFTNANTAVVQRFAKVAAAGSTISDATDLSAVFNAVSPVASGAGAQLWEAPLHAEIRVLNNNGANALSLYPPAASVSLNHYAAGSPVSIASNEEAICIKEDATTWFVRVRANVVLP